MSEPVTYDTQDSDGIKLAEVFEDCIGKDYAHVKTGGVYTIRDFIWDADTDQWAVLYQRKDCKGQKFKRLLKNFFWIEKDKPRFIKLDYGEQKPVPRKYDTGCCGENR